MVSCLVGCENTSANIISNNIHTYVRTTIHPAQVYWPPTPSLYSQLPQPSVSTLPELTLDAGFPLPAVRASWAAARACRALTSASPAPELALDGGFRFQMPLPV